MAGNQLKEVQRIAKEIRAKNPKMKHTEAVAEAWKVIKKGK